MSQLYNMFDYLRWRGDIAFRQVGITDADALIFSVLAYVRFEGIVSPSPGGTMPLGQAAQALRECPDRLERCRVEEDLALLEAAAATERFGRCLICHYNSVFLPSEETQFAAVTFLTDAGYAFLAFRGTDNSLVGWKEDFNMTFQEAVPAQLLARDYAQRFAHARDCPLVLGGHSKGGNLAVFAAATASPQVRDRVVKVYNHDGPGFTEHMMTDPGYLQIVPRIRTFVPQSSVFGMLLEHAEPYTVIRSSQIGLFQHDPYSWGILGSGFVAVEAPTEDSRFLDRTIRTWLAGMTPPERNEFFDTVYELATMENASRVRDVLRPQNLLALVKTLHTDESRRNLLRSVLLELVESARSTHAALSEEEP